MYEMMEAPRKEGRKHGNFDRESTRPKHPSDDERAEESMRRG
jgi:hypothetical protein